MDLNEQQQNDETQADLSPAKKEKKQIRISLFSAVVIALIVGVVAFISTFTILQNRSKAQLAQKEIELARYSKFEYLLNFVENQYVRGIEEDELLEKAYAALLEATDDPYSCYMTVKEYEEYTGDRQSSYVGIGVHVVFDPESSGIYVYRVTPDSPAERAGFQKGDIITQVGDIVVSSETYDDAVSAVKGESGTQVNFRLLRDGKELTLTATRGICKTIEVIYEKIDNVAYIQIVSFRSAVTVEQFSEALNQAKNDGCTAYLFDVRNNPGGDLGVICDVLDKLISDAVLVHMIDADGTETTRKTKTQEFLDAPMAVLCNKNSASAAELFTADLRDNCGAYLVGKTTYGKGTMQTVQKLSDGSAVKLTNRFYNPTSNVSYDKTGIIPDLEVDLPGGENTSIYLLTQEEDTQLQQALNYLRKINTK